MLTDLSRQGTRPSKDQARTESPALPESENVRHLNIGQRQSVDPNPVIY